MQKISPSGVKNKCTNRPHGTAGDAGLLAPSCCLQVKFTKFKWPVCFPLIGGAPLCARGCLLGSCSDDRALQKELCFRRLAEKMTPLICLPLLLSSQPVFAQVWM